METTVHLHPVGDRWYAVADPDRLLISDVTMTRREWVEAEGTRLLERAPDAGPRWLAFAFDRVGAEQRLRAQYGD
jgi:hypothetical protein